MEPAVRRPNHLIIIIMMEICKAPESAENAEQTSVTHIVYIEMETVISNLTKTNT